MTLELQEHTFGAPLNLTVRFYADTASFIRHLYKHIFDTQEGRAWARLLPLEEEPFSGLNRKKYIHRGGAMQDDDEGELLQSCYDAIVQFVERESAYSLCLPLFMRTEEGTRHPYTGDKMSRIVYHLMSEHGLLLRIRGDVLRTAFFSLPRGDSTSFYDLYWSGLRVMLEKAQRIRSGKYWYDVESNVHMHGLSAQMVHPENFSNAHNPWPITNTTRKRPMDPKRKGVEQIAGKYFAEG